MVTGKKKMAIGMLMLLAGVGLAGCGEQTKAAGDSKDRDLTVWTVQNSPATSAKTWKDSPWHVGYAKATGIDVEWSFPTKGNTGEQAFNLLTAQKELPDTIGYGFMSKAEQYIKDGIIRGWSEEELQEKAPNYWKYLIEHPKFNQAMKTDDGQYYMFGYNKSEDWQTTWSGPIINQTYLEELGMETPTSIQEWDDYLVAAKEKYGATLGMVNAVSPGFAGGFGAMGTSALVFMLKMVK